MDDISAATTIKQRRVMVTLRIVAKVVLLEARAKDESPGQCGDDANISLSIRFVLSFFVNWRILGAVGWSNESFAAFFMPPSSLRLSGLLG
jgi:hypothetical protein